MLGSRLLDDAPPGVTAIGATRADGDLADPDAVARLFAAHDPLHGVIHAAGYTDVDGAETDEPQAMRDNAEATRNVAAVCRREGVPLVFVSTDFVFDGESDRAYREDDATGPLCAYGRSKLAAERAAMEEHPKGTRIVRTSWLYGPGGHHFPGRILELVAQGRELSVVDDQRGCPTSTLELAPVIWDVLRHAEPGIYHAACEGACSWFELACAVTDASIRPCTTAEFPRPARRPRQSVLDCSKLAALRGRSLAHWREALERFLKV